MNDTNMTGTNETCPNPDKNGPFTEDCPYACNTTESWESCGSDTCVGTSFSGDLDWYHFLLTSIGTWLAAALIVLIPRLIYAPLKVRLLMNFTKKQVTNQYQDNIRFLLLKFQITWTSVRIIYVIYYSQGKRRKQQTTNCCRSHHCTTTSRRGLEK